MTNRQVTQHKQNEHLLEGAFRSKRHFLVTKRQRDIEDFLL